MYDISIVECMGVSVTVRADFFVLLVRFTVWRKEEIFGRWIDLYSLPCRQKRETSLGNLSTCTFLTVIKF